MSETISNNLSLSERAQIAMQRVPQAVIKRARETSTPVVVWIDGRTVHLTPDEAQRMVDEQAGQQQQQ